MTTIWVTWEQEGFHSLPARKEGDGRDYLALDHRHKFHFRLELQHFGFGKEVEFHELLGICKQTLWQSYPRRSEFELDFCAANCEHIANNLIKDVLEVLYDKDLYHPKCWAACEVSEDGECGARIERRAEAPQETP